MGTSNQPCFKIHPSVIYQLGESLISDVVQALIELVKNSYDADASYASIKIDTKGIYNSEGHKFSCENGSIVIEDDGFGMDRNAIENGWLTISNRQKNVLKQMKLTTPRGRTPLGDKGLGRLGVQRLGENVEIFTKAEKDIGYRFAFSWLDFQTAPSIAEVDIYFKEFDFPKKKGTKIVISGLREPEIWSGKNSLNRLQQEISKMISPFKQIREFFVSIEVNGIALELVEISDKVREIAPLRYKFKFDGDSFDVSGSARLDYFISDLDREDFSLILEADNGREFFDFLSQQKSAKTYSIIKSNSERNFLEFSWSRKLTDLDKFFPSPIQANEIANPGPFLGEIDFFNLGNTNFKRQGVFSKLQEFRKWIKEASGVKVYRDGFRVRAEEDWLKLGSQWTSGGSYYGLKPENTLGFIALTAKSNMVLEETTDREGFKDTPYYRNFSCILESFIRDTSKIQEFFRRAYLDFKKELNRRKARIDSRKTAEDITQSLEKDLAHAKHHDASLKSAREKARQCAADTKKLSSKVEQTKDVTPELKDEVAKTLNGLNETFKELDSRLDQASLFLKKVDEVKNTGAVIKDIIETFKSQMDEFYESVALGLTAEALSHEINNVADSLASRSKALRSSLLKSKINNPEINLFLEYVHSAIRALRKQLSFLSPSLRYVREERHIIDIYEFVNEIKDFYDAKSHASNIHIQVIDSGKRPFNLRINRGKLNQILDNLLLNSDYWLKEEIAQGRQNAGNIFIEISCPFLRIYDDGKGIDPHYEFRLFEPFVSGKQKGRGLGLFITRQLLESCGGSIGILPVRNKHDRLYKFQIDFRGALNE